MTPGRSKTGRAPLPDEWIRVTDAALQLGCHVATLRRRIRAGQLGARIGPGRAQYLSRAAVRRLLRLGTPTPGRPRTQWVQVADETLEGAWGWVMAALSHRDQDLDYALQLAADPARDRSTYRYVLAHGLFWAEGMPTAQVAGVLGITDRHVRRLLAWDLEWGLGAVAWRRLNREQRDDRLRLANRTIARLRARLRRQGVVSHIPIRYSRALPYRPSKPRQVKPERSPTAAAQLKDAGLSTQEIDAVFLVGLTAEELNELLIRGTK